jgi:TRAP-type uncharacterized transport system substrate-binding protein
MSHNLRAGQKFRCLLVGLLMLDCGAVGGARAQQMRVGVGVGAQAQKSDAPSLEAKSPAPPSKFEEAKRQSNANTVTIIASSASSTYTRFVEDIQNVLDDPRPNGLRVLPVLGRGGGQNFHDILFLRDIDMGTTHTDYLRYYKQKDPSLYGGVDKQIRYIAKLFNAEFHVLAPASVRSWNDLNGRKVNFFKPLSMTAMAAETIFSTLNINVQPTFFDNELALEKLRSGEIAAVVRMNGAPHNDYASVRPADKFHLVPLEEQNMTPEQYAKLMNLYFPASLNHEQYPQLIAEGQTVSTIAGSTLLAVYAWPENSERYRKLAGFVQKFFDNIEKFHDPARHPKWRDLNLATNIPGWTRFKPAQDWLDAHNLGPGEPNEPRLTGRDKALYEEFMKWRNSRKAPAAQP